MGKYITLLAGIIAIVIGIWGIKAWYWAFVVLLKGALPPVLILGGLAAFFAGIGEIKNAMHVKKRKKK
jgi:hypothetical protein